MTVGLSRFRLPLALKASRTLVNHVYWIIISVANRNVQDI